MTNPFFENTGPYIVNELLKSIGLNNDQNSNSDKITDIKDLSSSEKNNITFFHSKKYIELAKNTKASYCITSENLKSYLPKTCKYPICRYFLYLLYCQKLENSYVPIWRKVEKTSLFCH